MNFTYQFWEGESYQTDDAIGVRFQLTSPDGQEGTILYNAAHNVMQYCNGRQWIAIGKGFLAPPSGCPVIGNLCSDGTYYAGLTPDGNVPMYMADINSEITASWNDGNTNWSVTGFNSWSDGDGNTAGVAGADSDNVTVGVQTHDAAIHCNDLVAHGHSDWYLPARDEQALIYNGGTPVGDIRTDGTSYWTSTEQDFNNSHHGRFSDGAQNAGFTKDVVLSVRCVRK